MQKIIDYTKIVALALILFAGIAYVGAWDDAPPDPPNCTGQEGCSPPINTSNSSQVKEGGLAVHGRAWDLFKLFVGEFTNLGDPQNNYQVVGGELVQGSGNIPDSVKLRVDGAIAVENICSLNGDNCWGPPIGGSGWPWGGGGGGTTYSAGDGLNLNGSSFAFNETSIQNCGNAVGDKLIYDGTKLVCAQDRIGNATTGGVSQITAGTGISISPSGGTGNVTISATATGGGLAGVTTSGPLSGLTSNTSNNIAYLSLKTCSDDQVLKFSQEAGGWICQADQTGVGETDFAVSESASCASDLVGGNGVPSSNVCSLGTKAFCALSTVHRQRLAGSVNLEDAPPGWCAVRKIGNQWQLESTTEGSNLNSGLICRAYCIE